MGPDRENLLSPSCDDFRWHWWISGRWPRCTAVLSHVLVSNTQHGVEPWSVSRNVGLGGIHDTSCALAHAQQWSGLLWVLYEIILAFTFLDRYDSLLTRGPLSN